MILKKPIVNRSTLLLFAAMLFGALTYAQQVSVTGTVTSKEDGMPVPGVNVVEKGTSNGASTDFDGNYSLDVDANATLVFSAMGYGSVEVAVNGQSVVNAVIGEETNSLDEVVVIGYGTAKKSDLTGSVSSVKAKDLNAFPLQNAEQALQGRAAGVVVGSANGGEPGAPINIRVRGGTSIGAASNPLIVVDGFVGAQMPQPADIASMEVLKDASATAIYGSQASGGVILVTTKKGRAGKARIELNTSYAAQSITKELDLLNAQQFAGYRQAIDPNYTPGTANTDWQDLIYQSGSQQNYQLSVSGGTDDMSYYASGNYFDQKGVVINSGFQRLTFLGNIDVQATDWLKVGLNLYTNASDKDGISSQAGTGGRQGGDVISLAHRFAPDTPVQDENLLIQQIH